MGALRPVARICSPRTSKAPTGTSPFAAAARACSIANTMKAASRPSSARAVMRCGSRWQKQRGIDEYGVQCHTEMQVRSGHSPGCPDPADHLADPHARAALHLDRAQMAVHGDESRAVIEDHRVAIEEEVPGVEHTAV